MALGQIESNLRVPPLTTNRAPNLPADLSAQASGSRLAGIQFPVGATVEACERELIVQARSATKNDTKASELLGISLKKFHDKLKPYNIDESWNSWYVRYSPEGPSLGFVALTRNKTYRGGSNGFCPSHSCWSNAVSSSAV